MVFTALVFGDKHFNYKCNARKREGRKKLVVSHSSISIINFAKHLFVACCCVARSSSLLLFFVVIFILLSSRFEKIVVVLFVVNDLIYIQ
mgnify:FL=1|jgi:hypothetical protein|tara:strand:+ start:58 stop:327 length:270 start_codon:yes stop_codon:yes gene_type:complete